MIRHNKPKFYQAIFVALALFLLFFTGGCAGTMQNMDKYQVALDVHEIQNVMSRHNYYYSAGLHQRELDELWALEMPDVSWGSDEGWWVGKDLMLEYYIDYFDAFRAVDLKAFIKLHPEIEFSKENLGAGTSLYHTNTTPVIEVAEDGKTAKGLWYSVGKLMQTPGGKQSTVNMWERYGVDFIKVDGGWKIWHFFVHTDISAGAGESWASDTMQIPDLESGAMSEGGGQPPMMGGGEDEEHATKPSPTIASADGGRRGLSYDPPSEFPKVPVPYNTFSETFSYGAPL
jgi:hypothetical protein